MQRLTITHVRRWQENRRLVGLGHVYQGRYKSFPVEEDDHFLAVARYVERNALRAGLVSRAEDWRWSSLWRRCRGSVEEKAVLAEWPLHLPKDGVERVNRADNEKELQALRCSVDVPMARRIGSGKLPSVWGWNQRIVRTIGRRSHPARSKSSRPND